MRLQIRDWIRRYKNNRDGATAIEFAILALPFMALLFSIIELAVVFFLSSTLSHAMNETARDIRTGEFQATCGGATEFKDAVCDNMGTLGNCNNMRIDVVSSPTGRFEPGLLPPTPTTEDPSNPGEPQKNPDVYMSTSARSVVVVRAQYYHQLAFPGQFTRLSNQPGNNRVITASTAFRNEPFPDGGC
ncbi:MAG: pilus assembly protein [Hellea sp.]|nr:pilus assembly protein [Hellea sp.]